MATDPQQRFDADVRPFGAQGGQDARELREKAARCRRLASGISDQQAADVLRSMALSYEQDAQEIEGD